MSKAEPDCGVVSLDSTLVSSLFNVDDGMPNMNLFNENLLNKFMLGMPSSTLKRLETRVESRETTPQSGSAFDIELNTPQISEDQTDPMIRLFGKK
jgi:hypothetical protein